MKAKGIVSLILAVALICSLCSISATAKIVTEWRTMYDWESGYSSGVVTTENTDGNNLYIRSDSGDQVYKGEGYETSTKSLKFTGSGVIYNPEARTVARWMKVKLTDDVKTADDIRFPFYCTSDGTGFGYYGIQTTDGKYYWLDVRYDWRYQLISLVGKTLYTDPGQYVAGTNTQAYEPGGETFTVTKDNVKDISALCFSVCHMGGDAFVDDIQYSVTYEAAPPMATFDVEGIDPIQVDGDYNVVLPNASIAGKQFIGWQSEAGALYKAGETVKLDDDTAFSAVALDISLQTGAGIRWAKEEIERGIRFETYLSRDAIDILGSSSFEMGALILPYADYNANITVETASSYGAVNVVDPKVYGKTSDALNYRYYCGVVDFEKYFSVSQEALADLPLTAVSYIKITYNDGTSTYFYDHPDTVDNVRTVAQVARAALADTEFEYDATQIEILNLYNKYSKKTDVPSYRKDALDSMSMGEEVAFKIMDCQRVGSGFSENPYDNGKAINEYTPTGVVTHWYNGSWSKGSQLKITLPKAVKNGKYKLAFNTRGYPGRAIADISVESGAGVANAGNNVDFSPPFQPANDYWWNVTAPNTIQIQGETTITLTCTTAGALWLYNIVLMPVYNTYDMTALANSTRLIGRGEYIDNTLVCDWTTSGFECGLTFEGDLEINYSLTGSAGMIGVVINEDFDNMYTVNVNQNSTSSVVKTNVPYDYYKVRVIKLNECDFQTNSITFKSLGFNGKPSTKPAEKDLKIEVIGDSITAGYGNLGWVSNNFGERQDGSKTYAAMLARKLDADLNVIARSGWGLVSGGSGSSEQVMSSIWDKSIPKADSTKVWDFNKYTPDIVLINLGTNDTSAINNGLSVTTDGVKQKALDFCELIREKYPNATIVWLDGMMGNYNNTYATGVKNAINSIDDAYYCYLPGDWSGVDTHPNVAGHQNASNTLYNFLVENGIVE